jgi:hypothetical protein
MACTCDSNAFTEASTEARSGITVAGNTANRGGHRGPGQGPPRVWGAGGSGRRSREEKRTAAGEDEVLQLGDAGLEGGGQGVQRRDGAAPVGGVHRGREAAATAKRSGFERELKLRSDQCSKIRRGRYHFSKKIGKNPWKFDRKASEMIGLTLKISNTDKLAGFNDKSVSLIDKSTDFSKNRRGDFR